MNKYPSKANLEDKYIAARLAPKVRSVRLYCPYCERETPHFSQGRIGANGLPIYVCQDCGAERAA